MSPRFESRSLALAAPIVILIALLFREVISRLVGQCLANPDLSYTFFVPLLAGWALLTKRRQLATTAIGADSWGLGLTALACAVFLFGRLSAELYSSRCSLILLLGGLAWTFWGLRRFMVLLAPLVILLTAIPLPLVVYNLTAPLLSHVLSGAVSLLQQISIPVYRHADILETSQGSLDIARAGSGLRTLPTLVAFIAAWSWPTMNKVLVAFATIPVLLCCICVRTAAVLIWMDRSSTPVTAPAWLFSGWFITLLILIFLALVGLRGNRDHKWTAATSSR